MKDDEDQLAPPSWRELLFTYTQETTLHGIRYPTINTHKFRRFIWFAIILGAICTLLFIIFSNLVKLLDHPKSVNVEVTYKPELPFPAVTLCNQNVFKSTAVFEEGMYDVLVEHFSQDGDVEEDCKDSYTYDTSSCPAIESIISETSLLFRNVSFGVCMKLCSDAHSSMCYSIIYDRDHTSCLLTSDHHSDVTQDVIAMTDHCWRSPFELYHRHRCVGMGREMITCDFESLWALDTDTQCDLEVADDKAEKWQVMLTEDLATLKLEDHTFQSVQGHVLALGRTHTRQNFEARLFIEHRFYEDMCLEFFYMQLGDTDTSAIKFKVRMAVKHRAVRELFTSADQPSYEAKHWHKVFLQLPNGEYKLEITTLRPKAEDPIESGLLLDDISLWPCSRYERDCVATSDRTSYTGSKEVTEEGLRCISWVKAVDHHNRTAYASSAVRAMLDAFTASAGSSCRVPPDALTQTTHRNQKVIPWCFTGLGPYDWQYCQIAYCPCRIGQFRCEGNGLCIPDYLACDGVNNCDDGSDEISNICGADRSLTCSFENQYMCGYTSSKNYPMGWRRKKAGSELNEAIDVSYTHDWSSLKYILDIDGSTSNEGDRALLSSPQWTVSGQGQCVSFYYHMAYGDMDTVELLEVYVVTTTWDVIPLITIRENSGQKEWRKTSVPLPITTFRLKFEATIGFSYQSDISIDDISVEDCPGIPVVATRRKRSDDAAPDAPEGSASCSFDETLCDYNTSSTSYFSFWKRAPKSMFEVFSEPASGSSCGGEYRAYSGIIQTKDFPAFYPRQKCVYTFIAPETATITLTFLKVNVGFDDCSSDTITITDAININSTSTATTSLLCGKHITSPIVYESVANVMTMTFQSVAISTSFEGFRARYQMSEPSAGDPEDCVLVADMSLAKRGKQKTFLTSALMPPLTAPSCLLLDVYQGPVTVTGLLGDSSHDILDTEALLAPGWTSLRLTVPAMVKKIQITAHKDKAAINNIVHQPKACKAPEVDDIDVTSGETYKCKFEVDTCGFMDVSTSNSMWMRSILKKVVSEDTEDPAYFGGDYGYYATNEGGGGIPSEYYYYYDYGTDDSSNGNTNDADIDQGTYSTSEPQAYTDSDYNENGVTEETGSSDGDLDAETGDDEYADGTDATDTHQDVTAAPDTDLDADDEPTDSTNSSRGADSNSTNAPNTDLDIDGNATDAHDTNLDANVNTTDSPDPDLDTNDNTTDASDTDLDTHVNTTDAPDSELDAHDNVTDAPNPDLDTHDNTTDTPDSDLDTHANTTDAFDSELDTHDNTTDAFDSELDAHDNATDAADTDLDANGNTTDTPDSELDGHDNVTDAPDSDLDTHDNTTDAPDPDLDANDNLTDTPNSELDTHDNTTNSPDTDLESHINTTDAADTDLDAHVNATDDPNLELDDYYDATDDPNTDSNGDVTTEEPLRRRKRALPLLLSQKGSSKKLHPVKRHKRAVDEAGAEQEAKGVIVDNTTEEPLRRRKRALPLLLSQKGSSKKLHPVKRHKRAVDKAGAEQEAKATEYVLACDSLSLPGQGHCSLQSPWIIGEENMCLKVVHRAKDSFKLQARYKEESEVVFLSEYTYRPVSEWEPQQFSVPLPAGRYQVTIDADRAREGVTRIEIMALIVEAEPCPDTGDFNSYDYSNDASESGSTGGDDSEGKSRTVRQVSVWKEDGSLKPGYENITGNDVVKFTNTVPGTRKNVAANIDMDSLLDSTHHHVEDFIYSCNWKNVPCNMSYFTKEVTELGICYTFNSDPKDQLKTDLTGSFNGLSLVLNVEKYDHTKGVNSDAGIKLHLHDQGDVPSVSDTGIAVAMSTHTMIEIRYSKTKSLPDPYGDCGDKQLEYFPDNKYTYARCQRQCRTQQLEAYCNCRDAYMTGVSDIPVCTLDQYLSCVLQFYSKNQSVTTYTCEKCPDACEVVNFETEMSFASLSKLGALQLIKQNGKLQRLMKRFRAASETSARSETRHIVDTINQMEGIVDDLKGVLNYATQHSPASKGSFSSFSIKAVASIVKLFLGDVQNTLRDNIDALIGDYDVSYGHAVSELADFSNRVSDGMYQTLLLVISAVNKPISNFEFRNNVSFTYPNKIQYYLNKTKDNDPMIRFHRSNLGFVPRRLHKGGLAEASCEKHGQRLVTLAEEFNQFILNISNASGFTISKLETKLLASIYYDYMKAWNALEACLKVYRMMLNDMWEWLRTNTYTNGRIDMITGELETTLNIELLQKDLQVQLDTFRDWTRGYSMNDIPHFDLTEVFNEQLSVSVDNVLEVFEQGLMERYLLKIISAVEDIKKELVVVYGTVLQYLTDLHVHFEPQKEPSFESMARNMSIWKMPYTRPNAIESVLYRYKVSYVRWPKSRDLTTFTRNNGSRTVLKYIMSNYFESVETALAEFEATVKGYIKSLRTGMKTIVADMNTFRDDAIIDSQFVVDNFMKLDVYYGELKYEFVEQIPSYELIDFFSDMGGYMGLLLGASAMTVCEILDLFIYQGILKLVIAWKRRRKIGSAMSRHSVEAWTVVK